MIREDMRFDVRALPHRMRRRELSAEEVEAELAQLPDDAAEAEETTVVFSRNFEDRHNANKASRD